MAGATAAIRLAQKGVDVLLVERADEGGAKNLSGGILWGNDLARVLPDWKATMPVDRPVTNKKVGLLNPDGSAFVIDYHDPTLKENGVGFSVLRARTDKWLLDQAAKEGVTVVTGVNVESLFKDNGVVRGVEVAGEVTTADVVIIAEGANSRLTLEADLQHGQKRLDAHNMALGVKQVMKMDKKVMEDRFGIGPDGGMAAEFVFGREDSVMAGGFVYTNNDTLSLGVVINTATLKLGKGNNLSSHDIIEEFRLHPYIAALSKDAELVEYGAHLVPEGGYQAFSELYADGVIVCGDAAGFCFSNGIVIQGMNYAIRSGICAADAVVHAISKGDYSQVTLHKYLQLLEEDGIIKDFQRFKNVGKALWNPRLFNKYPAMMSNVFRNILGSEGDKKKMTAHLFDGMTQAGITKREAMADALTMGVNL
jgi:electron transfer flavoprotein-quinone oxidoreductase